MQRIAGADTLVKKRKVELYVMKSRLRSENNLNVPIGDEYGADCIKSMIEDIETEYDTQMGYAVDGVVDEVEDGDVSEGF
jgi:hypothetical protein